MTPDSRSRRLVVRPLVLIVLPVALGQVLLSVAAVLPSWAAVAQARGAAIGAGVCCALTATVLLTLWLAYRHLTSTSWLLLFWLASSVLATVHAWQLASPLPLLASLLVLIVPSVIVRRQTATIAVLISCGTAAAELLTLPLAAATMLQLLLIGGLLTATIVLAGRHLRLVHGQAADALTRADLADTRLARLERDQRFWHLQQRALRHDLRPPCTVVVQIVEQLQAPGSPQQYPALLHELKLQALRLRTRIDQLVEDARSQAAPDPDVVALDQVVSELAPDLRSLANAHRHADQKSAPEVLITAPPAAMIVTQRDTVIRIMENLVSNSARAGAQRIWITVVRGMQDVRLIVQDDGPGYPDDMVEASTFGTTVARHGTNGLGLPWIKAAMTQYGGQIELDNWHAAGDNGAQTTLVFVTAERATDELVSTSVWATSLSSRDRLIASSRSTRSGVGSG